MARLNCTIKQKNVTRVFLDDRREGIFLQCNSCGSTWSPNIQSGDRLPKGYWRCPNRCNYEEKEYKHPADVRAYFVQRNREQKAKKGEPKS